VSRAHTNRLFGGSIIDEWHDRAACSHRVVNGDASSDDWFTEPGSQGGMPYGMRRAIRVCMICPVRVSCAEHALFYPERWGVWGGTTERQRQSVRARLQAGELTGVEALNTLLDLSDDVAARLRLDGRTPA